MVGSLALCQIHEEAVFGSPQVAEPHLWEGGTCPLCVRGTRSDRVSSVAVPSSDL